MDEILPVGQSKNVLVTHAVGGTYFDDWSKYSSPTWIDYCKRHDLGLYVFNEKNQYDKRKKITLAKTTYRNISRNELGTQLNLTYLNFQMTNYS